MSLTVPEAYDRLVRAAAKGVQLQADEVPKRLMTPKLIKRRRERHYEATGATVSTVCTFPQPATWHVNPKYPLTARLLVARLESAEGFADTDEPLLVDVEFSWRRSTQRFGLYMQCVLTAETAAWLQGQPVASDEDDFFSDPAEGSITDEERSASAQQSLRLHASWGQNYDGRTAAELDAGNRQHLSAYLRTVLTVTSAYYAKPLSSLSVSPFGRLTPPHISNIYDWFAGQRTGSDLLRRAGVMPS